MLFGDMMSCGLFNMIVIIFGVFMCVVWEECILKVIDDVSVKCDVFGDWVLCFEWNVVGVIDNKDGSYFLLILKVELC